MEPAGDGVEVQPARITSFSPPASRVLMQDRCREFPPDRLMCRVRGRAKER